MFPHYDSDAGHIPYGDWADWPGDRPAPIKLLLESPTAADLCYVWFHTRLNNPQTTFYHDCQDVVDASRSGGEYVNKASTSTSWEGVELWTVHNVIEDMAAFLRFYAVIYDAGTTAAKWRICYQRGSSTTDLIYSDTAERSINGDWCLIDLGIINVKRPTLPITASANDFTFTLEVMRSSGTEAVRADFIMAIAADDIVGVICPDTTWPSTRYMTIDELSLPSEAAEVIVHGATMDVYNYNSPHVMTSLYLAPSGGRMYFMVARANKEHEIADSIRVRGVTYRPRGLHFRGSDL